MPIDYSQYHPKWSLISYLIRFVRAKGKCEECGVANYTVRRKNTITGKLELPCGNLYLDQAAENGFGSYKTAKLVADSWNEWDADGEGKWSVIVLTVAHLDHDKSNNRFWNLKALCQRCHLTLDNAQHMLNRKYGRNWKLNQLKLF
ncbi:hypothetical protein [Flagellimonas sp.]|uniref:hypothetical protein n=1 Tax=Flagellimonas sp. TaxID=2058762 RepID=UPI003BAAA45A